MRPLFFICLCSIALSACNRSAQSEGDRCSLKPDPGPCKAAIQSYYYDAKADECVMFYWGGCQGTVPFKTKEECQKCVGEK